MLVGIQISYLVVDKFVQKFRFLGIPRKYLDHFHTLAKLHDHNLANFVLIPKILDFVQVSMKVLEKQKFQCYFKGP